jgi:hypothetical protein
MNKAGCACGLVASFAALAFHLCPIHYEEAWDVQHPTTHGQYHPSESQEGGYIVSGGVAISSLTSTSTDVARAIPSKLWVSGLKARRSPAPPGAGKPTPGRSFYRGELIG